MDISIIITFYRHTDFLLRLLKSIQAQKNILENSINYEVIIVIDSVETSENELKDIVRAKITEAFFRNIVFVKNEKNLGVALSRNEGISVSRGRWLHIIDQDDEFCEDVYALIQHEAKADFILVNGYFNYEPQNDKHKIYYLKPKLLKKEIITDDFIRSPGQVLFKKDLAKNIAFRDVPCYRGCDDRFFWIEMFNANNIIKTLYIDKLCYVANIHQSNFSLDSMQLYKCSLAMWHVIGKEKFGTHKKYVESNIACLEYITNTKKSFSNLLHFLSYKYKPYRVIRYLFKVLKIN
jgi:glycosyltransferase involved in cell wall biosynthesis